ncbi:MAG: RNA methyltransferase [Candidatus Omnitrophica bacterium]|nr:RNA methyltransferase [Candidatus Omnitrophota bacterium]
MRKLTHEEIIARQVQKTREPRIPLVVVLDNIRSLYNVGAIFRTADGIGVSKLWLCGITGYPPQGDIAKTALGAEDSVPWEYSKDVVSVVRRLKQEKYKIVLLEQMEESVPYERFLPDGPVALVVGNEVEGVCDEVCALADKALEIGMLGVKNSLNVAIAFGVVAFDLRVKLSRG